MSTTRAVGFGLRDVTVFCDYQPLSRDRAGLFQNARGSDRRETCETRQTRLSDSYAFGIRIGAGLAVHKTAIYT